MRGYRLSKLADEDLLSIFRFTQETWDEEQVWIYLNLLETLRARIVENPNCPGSTSREDLAPAGCRILRAGKHYFVYRVRDDVVEIARILHESMDFERQIGDRESD